VRHPEGVQLWSLHRCLRAARSPPLRPPPTASATCRWPSGAAASLLLDHSVPTWCNCNCVRKCRAPAPALTRTCAAPAPAGVYETPGGTVLIAAHRAMESICLDREEIHLKVRRARPRRVRVPGRRPALMEGVRV